MPRNIFVLGLDEFNLASLHQLPHDEEYAFHPLLTIEELQQGDQIPFEELLDKAERQLAEFDEPIDAVVGYWDFPVSSMAPLLAARLGLPGAPLEAVVKCEHKYWSRLEQAKVTDAYPRFAAFDPHDDRAADSLGLAYPFWVKPIKAFSSQLAFRIDDSEGLQTAVAQIRERIDRVGEPFDHVLEYVDTPAEIAELGGSACIAEEAVGGQQITVEGYVAEDQPVVYGIVDSIPYEGTSSFQRFQYPSAAPEQVRQRMTDVATRVIAQIGLVRSTFNVEMFWDAEHDELNVLEVNPRHSQSHAMLFSYVDGIPNHKLMLDLPLGRDPGVVRDAGPYRLAAKWFLRRFSDALVVRAPSDEQVAAIEQEIPGTAIHLVAREGARLSELHDQDAYSYKVANIYVGADDEEELEAKYHRCAEALPYTFEE